MQLNKRSLSDLVTPPDNQNERARHVFQNSHDLIKVLLGHCSHVSQVFISHLTRQMEGLPLDRPLHQNLAEDCIVWTTFTCKFNLFFPLSLCIFFLFFSCVPLAWTLCCVRSECYSGKNNECTTNTNIPEIEALLMITMKSHLFCFEDQLLSKTKQNKKPSWIVCC